MSNKKPLFFAASYVLLMDGNKVLLSRRANTSWRNGEYSLPSGHLEDHEDASVCAIREVKEEVNVDIKNEDLKFAHCCERSTPQEDGGPNRTYFDVFFVAKKWSGKIKNNEPDKCDDLLWADINKIPKNTVPMLKKIFKLIQKGIAFSEVHE
jgi:8-oxo-dGTP diphosphatase